MKTGTKTGNMLFAAAGALILILLDQASKQAAQECLRGKAAVVLVKGVFELQYLENRGGSFGMLQGQKALFILTAALMLVLLPYVYANIPLDRRFLYLRIIAVLAFSGAAGNLLDRILHGYVIDFFYFSLIDFPIFNAADIYLTTAAALLGVLILFYYKDEDFEQIHLFRRK